MATRCLRAKLFPHAISVSPTQKASRRHQCSSRATRRALTNRLVVGVANVNPKQNTAPKCQRARAENHQQRTDAVDAHVAQYTILALDSPAHTTLGYMLAALLLAQRYCARRNVAILMPGSPGCTVSMGQIGREATGHAGSAG
jgi:hypothetical protein